MAATIIDVASHDPRLIHILAVHARYAAAHTPVGSGHALSASGPEPASGAAEGGEVTMRFWLAVEGANALGSIALRLAAGSQPSSSSTRATFGRSAESNKSPSAGERVSVNDPAPDSGRGISRYLDAYQGEVKALHVLQAHLGRGLARALLRRVEDEARAVGLRALCLETGRGPGFAASRALYLAEGYRPCPPFGPYAHDPFSACFDKQISPRLNPG